MHVSAIAFDGQKGVPDPLKLTGSCERPDMGAGNHTQVLGSSVRATTEPYPQPC